LLLGSPSFIPGAPPRRGHWAAAAGSAAALGSAPVLADPIGDAAKKLADASYPFAREVDWNSAIYLQAPGQFAPLEALRAIDKMIVLGSQADPKLLKAAAQAHHKAISSISGPNGVTSKADWEAVNAALGRVFASVPESSVMDVYDAVVKITAIGVPEYLQSKVKAEDAEKAYAAFLEFKEVVKDSQVSSAVTPKPAVLGDKFDAAAQALADQSYPFLKNIDWTSDLYLKPLPGVSAAKALKAVDKAIVMGSAMDGNLLKAAASAHHQAIGSIDSAGVTSVADYATVVASLGRAIATVPRPEVMAVYNEFAGIVAPSVPSTLFSKVDPLAANAAAAAFYEFGNVVKAAQR